MGNASQHGISYITITEDVIQRFIYTVVVGVAFLKLDSIAYTVTNLRSRG